MYSTCIHDIDRKSVKWSTVATLARSVKEANYRSAPRALFSRFYIKEKVEETDKTILNSSPSDFPHFECEKSWSNRRPTGSPSIKLRIRRVLRAVVFTKTEYAVNCLNRNQCNSASNIQQAVQIRDCRTRTVKCSAVTVNPLLSCVSTKD